MGRQVTVVSEADMVGPDCQGSNLSSTATSYMTLGEILNLSVPQFPHLGTGDTNKTYFAGLLH